MAQHAKVRVRHGLARRQSLLVIVAQQLVEKVDGFRDSEVLVLGRHEALPGLLAVRAEQVHKVRVEHQAVLVEVGVEISRAEHLGDLDQLVLVVVAMEEWLLAEDLSRGRESERERERERERARERR